MSCVVALYALLAAAAPDERGPHAFTDFSAGEIAAAGTDIPLRVYHPTDLREPGPLVAVVHGFVRNGSFMAELARTVASRGMIAIVPDMPCNLTRGCDHDANARQISALFDWAIAASANDSASPLYGLVDPERLGVIGHSWGGLGVFLSAHGDPRIDSVVVLDPNDDRQIARDAAPTIPHATMHVMAENRGSCNNTDWGTTVFPLTPAPHMRVRVVGSGHCDAEDPSDGFCPTFCGSGDPATTPLFRRYAIAWTECQLFGVGGEWIGGAELDADVARNAIDSVSFAGLEALPCKAVAPPPADAGSPPPADAGVMHSDASTPDAEPDGGSSPSPSPGPGAAEAKGCTAVPRSAGDLWLFFALVVFLGARKRHALLCSRSSPASKPSRASDPTPAPVEMRPCRSTARTHPSPKTWVSRPLASMTVASRTWAYPTSANPTPASRTAACRTNAASPAPRSAA